MFSYNILLKKIRDDLVYLQRAWKIFTIPNPPKIFEIFYLNPLYFLRCTAKMDAQTTQAKPSTAGSGFFVLIQ
jgi:hypothetical protein